MRSFRAKPVGWRNESYRHYLAAKGIKTRYLAARDKTKDFYGGDKLRETRLKKQFIQDFLDATKREDIQEMKYIQGRTARLEAREGKRIVAKMNELKGLWQKLGVDQETIDENLERYMRRANEGERMAVEDELDMEIEAAQANDEKGIYFSKKDLLVTVERPENGKMYPISPKEANTVIKRQPEHESLKSIEFANPRDKDQEQAWAQYVRSRKAIKIFAQPRHEAYAANKHMKEYVLPHEVGHHRALKTGHTDADIRVAEARADANVVGMDPFDRDVRMLVR